MYQRDCPFDVATVQVAAVLSVWGVADPAKLKEAKLLHQGSFEIGKRAAG